MRRRCSGHHRVDRVYLRTGGSLRVFTTLRDWTRRVKVEVVGITVPEYPIAYRGVRSAGWRNPRIPDSGRREDLQQEHAPMVATSTRMTPPSSGSPPGGGTDEKVSTRDQTRISAEAEEQLQPDADRHLARSHARSPPRKDHSTALTARVPCGTPARDPSRRPAQPRERTAAGRPSGSTSGGSRSARTRSVSPRCRWPSSRVHVPTDTRYAGPANAKRRGGTRAISDRQDDDL